MNIDYVSKMVKDKIIYFSVKRKYDSDVKVLCEKLPKLSSDETNEVNKIWRPYQKVNTNWARYYKECNGEFSPYYIPSDIYFSKICRRLNRMSEIGRSHYQEKNYFDLIFPDVIRPRTIIRNINGEYLDENYSLISKKDIIKRCKNYSEIVVKNSWDTTCAKGVDVIANGENFEEKIIKSIKEHGKDFIIQNTIKQNSGMSSLNADSVNTVRVLTLFWGDKVQTIAGFVRIGVPGIRVDNLAVSNGVSVAIDIKRGVFANDGFTKSGERIKKLPNGIELRNYAIPYFEKIKSEAERLHTRLPNTRIIGWDMVADVDGNVVLIESNMDFPELIFHQQGTGPLFGSGELFREVMDYTYHGDK